MYYLVNHHLSFVIWISACSWCDWCNLFIWFCLLFYPSICEMGVSIIICKSNGDIVENDLVEVYRFAEAVAAFLAHLDGCCFMWLLKRSDYSSWDNILIENLKNSLMPVLTYPCYGYITNSSLSQKGTGNISVTHSVLGILKTGSSEAFSNIYVLYRSTEYCCHANQPASIYFRQRISPADFAQSLFHSFDFLPV